MLVCKLIADHHEPRDYHDVESDVTVNGAANWTRIG
jgi:hypothetical protein